MTRNAPRGPMVQLCNELLKTIPNSTYLTRHGFPLKKLIPVVRYRTVLSLENRILGTEKGLHRYARPISR